MPILFYKVIYLIHRYYIFWVRCWLLENFIIILLHLLNPSFHKLPRISHPNINHDLLYNLCMHLHLTRFIHFFFYLPLTYHSFYMQLHYQINFFWYISTHNISKLKLIISFVIVSTFDNISTTYFLHTYYTHC